MDRWIERVFERIPIPLRVVVIWLLLSAVWFLIMPFMQYHLPKL